MNDSLKQRRPYNSSAGPAVEPAVGAQSVPAVEQHSHQRKHMMLPSGPFNHLVSPRGLRSPQPQGRPRAPSQSSQALRVSCDAARAIPSLPQQRSVYTIHLSGTASGARGEQSLSSTAAWDTPIPSFRGHHSHHGRKLLLTKQGDHSRERREEKQLHCSLESHAPWLLERLGQGFPRVRNPFRWVLRRSSPMIAPTAIR
jgi:hypothetical protein